MNPKSSIDSQGNIVYWNWKFASKMLARCELHHTVYPKKFAHGFCFAVLCCGCTLTDCPISIRLTSLALWQSNDCPSASKATLMNMDKYFIWIHYERLHNHNKAKHNKTVCIFLGIYCTSLRCRVHCRNRTAVPTNHHKHFPATTNITSFVLLRNTKEV